MLQPCPACARHVRSGTTACPFCDARFEARVEAPMPAPPPGLSRAALLALTALAAAGCTEAQAQSRDSGTGLSGFEHASPAAGYGAPPAVGSYDPPTHPLPPSSVTLGPVVAVHPNDARLTATAARTVLRSDIPRVRLCHDRARRVNPALAGTLAVRIEISATGAVTGRPEVTGMENSAELVDCVAGMLGQQRFPAPHAVSVVRASFLLR